MNKIAIISSVTIAIVAPCIYLLLIGSHLGADGDNSGKIEILSGSNEALEAEIIANNSPDSSSIEIGFVLKNKSPEPVILYERWNSWGSRQWSFVLEDSIGGLWHFDNPQMTWTMNFPSTLEIQPGKYYKMDCRLLISKKTDPTNQKGLIFTTLTKGDISDYPLKIKGVFHSKIDASTQPNQIVKLNWEGTIVSNTLILEK